MNSQILTILFVSKHLVFYSQYGDDHPRELEDLWSALVVCWPNNLRVVIHYLVIITNMAASELMQYVSEKKNDNVPAGYWIIVRIYFFFKY